jgi:hypothetical protein
MFAPSASDDDRFDHQRTHERKAVGVGEHLAERRAAKRADAVGTVIAHQLVPANRLQVGGQLAEDPGAAENFRDTLGARSLATVQFAELDPAERGVEHFTRRYHLGPDARVPAHDGVAREELAENFFVLDAILDRHEGAVLGEASF